jgi:hypothetical protein
MILTWSGASADAQGLVRPCGIGSAGDACIFDIEALANGTLIVDTRATSPAQRWRTAIAVAGSAAITSNIGSGSTSAFSGRVSRTVAAGRKYEVVVVYEGPLAPAFPTTVDVRFSGPVVVGDAREGPPIPAPDRYTGRLGSSPFFSFTTSADGLYVAEVRVTNHSCLGALTSFVVPLGPEKAPIQIGPDGRRRFDVRNVPIPPGNTSTLDFEGVLMDADGVGNTAEHALGGASLVIRLGRCNASWTAGAVVPDSDHDAWHDAAEIQLGSSPYNGASTPEHLDVPTTPLRGPDSCQDLVDNDRDGLVDSADPDCAPS